MILTGSKEIFYCKVLLIYECYFRQTLFAVCRELQQLFNEERERCIKTVTFTKNLFKTTEIPEDCLFEVKVSYIDMILDNILIVIYCFRNLSSHSNALYQMQ